jgi:hypothetical protein
VEDFDNGFAFGAGVLAMEVDVQRSFREGAVR